MIVAKFNSVEAAQLQCFCAVRFIMGKCGWNFFRALQCLGQKLHSFGKYAMHTKEQILRIKKVYIHKKW